MPRGLPAAGSGFSVQVLPLRLRAFPFNPSRGRAGLRKSCFDTLLPGRNLRSGFVPYLTLGYAVVLAAPLFRAVAGRRRNSEPLLLGDLRSQHCSDLGRNLRAARLPSVRLRPPPFPRVSLTWSGRSIVKRISQTSTYSLRTSSDLL